MQPSKQNLTLSLPDDVIEHTRQLLNVGEAYQWVLGDYLVEQVGDLSAEYAAYMGERDAVRAAKKARAWIITELANRTGADTSTLRDRHNMAEFFPVTVRDEFDMLSWSQLRACKSAGDEWRKYAEYAAVNLPMPVSLLRAHIKHNGCLPPIWQGRWERAHELIVLLEADSDTPLMVRAACRLCLWMAE